tara:strand:+ start:354 stop:572 length:219 start_codon:yes stop_codon:yes gene_type:complete
MVTHEIFEHLEPQLNENTARIYNFEKAMLGPALQIMRRGIRMDHIKRLELKTLRAIGGSKRHPALRNVWITL